MAKKKAVKKSGTMSTEVKRYMMQCNLQAKGDGPYASMSSAELEKAFDLAGARVTYASEQRAYWTQEAYKRHLEFDKVTVAYKQRKHGFTDEQVKGNPPTSATVWSYAG